MLIYLIVFLVVELFAFFSTKNNDKNETKKTKNNNFHIIIIIFLLSLLGGLRSVNIGTDVLVYGKRWFDVACASNSFNEYISIINTTDTGYLLINYTVSRFTNNINIFLFIHQLICNSLVIYTLYHYKEKCPFWLSTLCYICLFYCKTFNILRQAVALSMIFYSTRYLEEKKYKKYIISIMITSTFHFTAIFGIILLPLKKICESNSKYKKIYLFLIIFITIIVSISIKNVITLLYNNGIVNGRIYNYLFEFVNETGSILNGETFFKTAFLGMIIMSKKNLENENNINTFLIMTLIIEYILFQIRNQIMYADRISSYFGYLIMLTLPQLPKSIKDPKDRLSIYLIISMLLILYWYYKFIHSGSCEIYPFEFFF